MKLGQGWRAKENCHPFLCLQCSLRVIVIKIDMLLNNLFVSALSVLKAYSMMYFVLLCKLLFGLSSVQTV